MRLYENFLFSSIMLGLLWCDIFGRHGRGQLLVTLLACALLVMHLWKERAHWQLAPTYLAFCLLPLSILSHGTIQTVVVTAGLFCILSGEMLCLLLPMFRFLPVTGPYPTGTSIHHLIDISGEDLSPSGHRELIIQLWYPAAASRAPFATYRRREETTRMSSYQAVLATSSRLNAPLAQASEKFPVFLFNPAWNGRRTQNTFLTEELASHGFVVAAIDHTGNSEPVAFPDGRVVWAEHVRAMEDVSTSTAEEVQRIGNREVEKQARDCRFVLDELARWSQDPASPWHQRLATEIAGAFGHSLGGAVSVECWATDPRVRAAINLDGWTFGPQATTGKRSIAAHTAAAAGKHPPEAAAPLLFFYEGNYNPDPATPDGRPEVERQVNAWDARNVRTLLANYAGYMLRLEGANHLNFTDRPATSPLRRLAGGGIIKPERAHQILRAHAVQFFLAALRAQPSSLLGEEITRYPEVSMLAYVPPNQVDAAGEDQHNPVTTPLATQAGSATS